MSWIPVEERLPKTNGHYLVTIYKEYDDTCETYWCYYNRNLDMWGNGTLNVIAWQPLPAPYVKPRRFVVGRTGETSMRDYLYKRIVSAGFYVLDYDNSDRPCADRIPTREAAEAIAKVYEEAYR